MKQFIFGVITICVCLLTASHSAAFTLRPPWVPQTQFAGYYMAVKKGFYKNAGIDIKIKDGGPNVMGLREISAGETDLTIAWLIPAMRLKSQGEKLVHVGQFFQKNSLLLLAKKSSGIDSVEKFAGHTLGVWPGDFQIPPKALIRKYRIRNVNIIQQEFTMEPFLKGDIEIASAMRYNEYHQVLETGIKPEDLTVFSYSDLGMNLPEDGVYVHEDFYKNNPDVCKKFVKASMEGWKYVFAHKDEAVKMMTKLANATPFKTTEKKQRIMLDEVEKLIDFNDTGLKKEDFRTALEVLKSARIIKKKLDYDAFVGKK
ncbi:MAG: ABC transporter substrate-binding protein [Desulfobacterales bacterium]|nr:ABC transporter substrate-binding protein [Desulfobacterales bacterium]